MHNTVLVTLQCTRHVQKVDTKVLNMYNIFNLQMRHCEWIACLLLLIKRYNVFNLLKPNDYMMHQQFNIQQLYALPTLYLYVLYLPENKQRLVPLTA